KELDGLVAREDGHDKVILPIWHQVSADDILKYSPMLAGRIAVSTSRGLAHVAERILETVRREAGDSRPQDRLVKSEREILEQVGKQMLVARSSWELRQTLYELEEYLAKYPHSPDARLLKDRIQVAVKRTEAMEDSPPARNVPQTSYGPPIWPIIVGVAVIVFLIFLSFLFVFFFL